MPGIKFIRGNVTAEISEGGSLRDAAIIAGIDITSPCAGHGLCGKCVVRIVSGNARGEIDDRGYCLACKTYPLTDCEIDIPDSSASGRLQIPEFPSIRSGGIEPLAQVDKDALGVAVDLGTTSVVGILLRLATGDIISTQSARNTQVKYGEDVISRISHAMTGNGLNELQDSIVECLNGIIERLCIDGDLDSADITSVVVSGNATMTHLLLGISPYKLGQSPYKPEFHEHAPIPAENAGITGCGAAQLQVLPNIAGFIGGDTVAGIIASGIHHSDTLKLFIDIGTNGEIVVGNKDRLMAASAAAGPAFEGGRIGHGMRAETGAIDHVRIGDDVTISTIGNAKPRGICGSGLFEAVAGMLASGLIKPDGRLLSDEGTGNIPKALSERFDGAGGKRRFYLHREGEDDANRIAITQKDIAELQLAKAAIRAAVELLLDEWGAGFDDVDEVLLAGAFGHYLRVSDINIIGLLPEVTGSKLRFIGNASLEGAVMTLMSPVLIDKATEIASSVHFVELANRPEFQDIFVDSMAFPV